MGLNSSNYKKFHKPNLSENSKWHQGYFTPTNKEKCLSKENIYRSGWELAFCQWCDRNPKVKQWASEPISIPYKNPVSNMAYCKKNNIDPKDPRNWKMANYHTDFYLQLELADGTVKKIFTEIKPYAQTQKPTPISTTASLKEQRRYCREAETYLVNCAKWDAAKKYFKARGCEFMVFTERTLEKLGCL